MVNTILQRQAVSELMHHGVLLFRKLRRHCQQIVRKELLHITSKYQVKGMQVTTELCTV